MRLITALFCFLALASIASHAQPENTPEWVNCYSYDNAGNRITRSIGIKSLQGGEEPEKGDAEKEIITSSGFIKVYPNPSFGIVNIEGLDAESPTSCIIYDQQGKQVHSESLNAGYRTEINLTQLSNGTYLLELQTKEGRLSWSLIIQ